MSYRFTNLELLDARDEAKEGRSTVIYGVLFLGVLWLLWWVDNPLWSLLTIGVIFDWLGCVFKLRRLEEEDKVNRRAEALEDHS